MKGNGMERMQHFLRFALNFSAKNRDLCLCLAHLATELYFSDEKYKKYIEKIYTNTTNSYLNCWSKE